MFQIKTKLSELEFQQLLNLRFRVLRAPLNQPRGSEKDSGDETNLHIAIFENEKIIGIGRLDGLENQSIEAQARFVAVDPDFQGLGKGKIIMQELERIARLQGKKRMMLQARDYAVPFYKSIGYNLIEKSHLLYGVLQHYKMSKKL